MDSFVLLMLMILELLLTFLIGFFICALTPCCYVTVLVVMLNELAPLKDRFSIITMGFSQRQNTSTSTKKLRYEIFYSSLGLIMYATSLHGN